MTVIPHIVEQEILDTREKIAFFEERENLALVAVDEILIGRFVAVSPRVFHAVFFFKALDLTVTEHRQARHCRHKSANAEIFVAFSELCDRRFFIGVVHEVDISLQNLRVKIDCVFDRLAIFVIFFFFEHVHERRIVDSVHSERSREVAFHHPERFGEQKRVGNFLRNTVNDLAPEFVRNSVFKFLCGEREFASGRNVAAFSWLRVPQSLDVLFRQNHRRVKADNREIPGHMQDFLHDFFSRDRIQKVNLSRVVPWHSRAVVPVIDVSGVASLGVNALEADRAV